jgi:hypothetical protein
MERLQEVVSPERLPAAGRESKGIYIKPKYFEAEPFSGSNFIHHQATKPQRNTSFFTEEFYYF